MTRGPSVGTVVWKATRNTLLWAGVLMLAYVVFLRPWQMRWGATDAEISRRMPGDDLVQSTDLDATRAITVAASPEQVWPWLVEIGAGSESAAANGADARIERNARRAGEVSLAGQLSVGAPVQATSPEHETLWVKEVEPCRWMVLWDKHGDYSSSWALYAAPGGGTRVVTRQRARYPWGSPRLLYSLLADAGSLVRIRQSLIALKQHAEGSLMD